MSDDKPLRKLWDAGLTDEEYWVIGNIVAQWGALEAEVFNQTLMSFKEDVDIHALPKEMNNLNFTSVLELWKERVVDASDGDTKELLENAYKKISALKDVRNSIIHGMWDFSLHEPATISTMRVKKDKVIHAKFEDGYLHEFSSDIAELNMTIRYPGGMEEFFQERMSEGGYVNEAALRRMMLEKVKSKS